MIQNKFLIVKCLRVQKCGTQMISTEQTLKEPEWFLGSVIYSIIIRYFFCLEHIKK